MTSFLLICAWPNRRKRIFAKVVRESIVNDEAHKNRFLANLPPNWFSSCFSTRTFWFSLNDPSWVSVPKTPLPHWGIKNWTKREGEWDPYVNFSEKSESTIQKIVRKSLFTKVGKNWRLFVTVKINGFSY